MPKNESFWDMNGNLSVISEKQDYIGISKKQSLISFVTGDCRISDMDRHTIAGTGEFVASPDDEFMENNCVDDPVRLCDFQLLENRIMKTVDSVYQVK